MTDHIFYYISEVLLAYFKSAAIQPGERFHIRYEQENQVDTQYRIMEQSALAQGYIITPFSFSDYTSYQIEFENFRLILAASTNGIEVDFLTGLRNRVGDTNLAEFQNAAILFIHHTSLDSIVGGCKSMADAGMPLSSNYIKLNIRERIVSDDHFSNFQKEVLNYRLAQVGRSNEDSYSLFDYGIFLEILGKKLLEDSDYRLLGLFVDSGLKNQQVEEIQKRLSQNDKWYAEIYQAHQYGSAERILEKTFSPKGVEILSKSDWAQRDFTELEKSAAEKDVIQNIEYLKDSRQITDDLLTLWDKEEGETAAKMRLRHLIIFNPDHQEKISFNLQFDGKPKKEGISSDKYNVSDQELTIKGTKINWGITLNKPEQPVFKRFVYTHPGGSARHVFHLLILPLKAHFLLAFKPYYLIKFKTRDWLLELTEKPEFVLNTGHERALTEVIADGGQYTLEADQTLKLKVKDTAEEQEQEEINFTITHQEISLPFKLTIETEKTIFISGKEVWNKKLKTGDSFDYVNWFDSTKNKEVVILLHGTSRYYPDDDFRKNLKLEVELIESDQLAYFQDRTGSLTNNPDVTFDDLIAKAYHRLTAYYRDKNLLPSLAAPDEELLVLYREWVTIFTKALNELEEGKALSQTEHDLLKIGTVEMLDGERLLKFTPLHPLNIAYQLRVRDAIGDQEIAGYLLEKLRPLNLVPFIKGKRKQYTGGHFYYQPFEQEHSAEWLYYFCDEVSTQQITKHFVPGLVREKIEQFLKHFRYLFISEKACLRVNLFNQGDAREILLGMLQFYARYFRKEQGNPDAAPPIEVRIYGSRNYLTKFEELTLYDDVASLEQAFKFKFPIIAEPDELLDLYNRKVTFFKVDDQQVDYTYAHLSFYQFAPSAVQKSFNNMQQVPTGVSLGGLLADVPSVYQSEAFRTGFGTEGLDLQQNELLALATAFNAFVNITHSDDQYDPQRAIAFVINRNANTTIEQVYRKSQWVTFIEPKVDLSFFKSYRDVVIIHYSDQYNNASGYDAITITGKWEPYKVSIQEVFQEAQSQLSDEQVIPIIGLFNAINGNWLLSLNSFNRNNTNNRAEKLSLLSAVKTSLAFLDHTDITWVPVSMEEILRVSGAVGLTKADGLFSVKNLGEKGEHSDDLLLIGLENKEGELKMHLYPIEVKIGNVETTTYQKAKIQGRKTAGLLRKFLHNTPQLSGQIYRNFFAKLLLINAEKCVLYDVWPERNERWHALQSVRNLLLQDQFTISTELDSCINQFGVIAYKWSAAYMPRSIQYEDDGAIITLLKEDGLNYLKRDMEELNVAFGAGDISPISVDQLLRARYPDLVVSNVEPIATEATEAETDHELSTPAEEESLVIEVPEVIVEYPVLVESLVFNQLSHQDVELAYLAVFEKLNSIGATIIKQLLSEIRYIEGPAFYRLQILPAPTTTLRKIRNSVDELNIALQLREGEQVRIFSDLGKVWLEIPKQESQKITVTTEHIWRSFEKNSDFRVPFGTDIEGKVQSINFSSSNSPHLLLAGTTGSGKSVVLDTLIHSATKFYTPQELQLFLIDPKGNELIDFQKLPHVPEPNGRSSAEAIALLQKGVDEMEKRYSLFTAVWEKTGKAAKDLNEYNQVSDPAQRLARWLIVLDEYSDLLDEDSANKSTIETLLRRLAQKARAAGIHVIVATQKPLATIVSSAIKSNLPGVIALRVRTGVDSRVILDDQGAETLAGKGDALFKNGSGLMIRVQCAIH